MDITLISQVAVCQLVSIDFYKMTSNISKVRRANNEHVVPREIPRDLVGISRKGRIAHCYTRHLGQRVIEFM